MKNNVLILIILFISHSVPAKDIDQLLIDRAYNEALECVNEQLGQNSSGELYFKRATIYQKLEKYQEALNDLKAALITDPDNKKYYQEIGDVYSTLGNYYEAISSYETVIQFTPEEYLVRGKLGKCYINVDEFEKAYKVFGMLYDIDSMNISYNRQFAYAAFKTGRIDQSIHLYEQILTNNPRDFGSHTNIIALYLKKRDSSMVYRSCERALSEFPDNQALLLKKANSLFALRDYERALRPYELYLASNDSVWEVIKNYGICLYFSAKEEDAVRMLEKCYYQVPDDQFVSFYLGLCYKKMSDYKQSADFLKLAIVCTQPSYLSEMYHYLGQVYGLDRKFSESINALEKAYEYDPKNPEILFEIATTFEEYDYNKTHALAYYNSYLKEAGESARNADYALDRIRKIKEDIFLSGEPRE